MSYEITLRIRDGSAAEHNIEALAQAEQMSREDAALKLLDSLPAALARRSKATPAARRIIGAFKQDAALMDETLQLAMADRQRRNAAPPQG